ncbi:flagellar biosynthesis protein FlhF [Marinobacterium jannaschii]|uniref:flagellar biosynthesis protein FlhF n=1 Tax=Marinobacterium jannaschii TaxID=64970 RepID=UPI00048168D5|nr:flagellar biosynthesis protein FlhF [Marinobacterium jannaschii]
MKVKRFFAPDMRQAMRRVREEIGPDAVIVSNHKVAGGVEVVAAHEQEYEAAQAEFKSERQRRQRRDEQVKTLTSKGRPEPDLSDELRKAQARIAAAQQGEPLEPPSGRNRQIERDSEEDLRAILDSLKDRQKARADQAHRHFVQAREEPAVPPAPAHPSAEEQARISAMQQEINQLKTMLQQQMQQQQVQQQQMQQPPPPPPPQSNGAQAGPVARKLELLGISDRLRVHLMSGVESGLEPESAWRNTLAKLSDSIPVIGDDFIERGGMIAFLGPTGVGKTTTIGKLAARYVLQNGSSSVALVTTDTYRIAAHEQLKTFGRILDVPVRVVDESHPLDEVLKSLRNKRLVLIDTAGLNAQEAHSQDQLEMLENISVRMKKLLVVSCSSQRQLMEQGYAAYAKLGLHGCVLSKLDESGSLGDALSFVVERKLSVAYVADGQKIPDDIGVARKHDLVSRAVVTAQKSIEAGYSNISAGLGGNEFHKVG